MSEEKRTKRTGEKKQKRKDRKKWAKEIILCPFFKII
jgi:hypothetical protein